MNRRPNRRATRSGFSDRGQMLPMIAIVILVVGAMSVVAVRVGELLDASAQARTAADAAALAGAAAGETEAEAIARANGGEIVAYDEIGGIVMVVVRVGPATSEAWAEAVVRWVPAAPG